LRFIRRRSTWWLGALLGPLVSSCSPETTGVLTGLEIVVAEGDAQYGTVGQLLGTPLRAVVRSETSQMAEEGISVLWEVQSGSATLVGSGVASSDSTGSVETRVQLSSVPSEVVVRATVAAQTSAWTEFTLHVVDVPVVSGVNPTAAAAGDTVTLTGANFSPVAAQDVVLFSGIRGRVVSASGTQLEVEVPRCLPARDVAVRVQLGIVGSGSVTLSVTGGGELTTLSVGEVLYVPDDGFACYGLPGGAGVEYLALVYSASTVGAAKHPYEFVALSSSTPAAALPAAKAPAQLSPGLKVDPQAAWDERVRALETELLSNRRSRPAAGVVPVGVGPAAVPTVGESRVFQVLQLGDEYTTVFAQAQYVGAEAAIFVDQDAPAGGFTVTDLEVLAARFDDVVHPEVTGVFGSTSDIDANERVIILFTPAVNSLTPRGAAGFIGGFFFGNDLLGSANSNQGEVFYALVPDPTGEFSDPRTKSQILSVVPAVLAHEFQHMVQFNERYLELDGGQEATWLSEALAQMAEEIVARRYDELIDPTSAELFRSGTRSRARQYLTATDTVSLIFSTVQGTLEERGAGFLHLLYLSDQEGMELLGRLTATTRRSVANLEVEVGLDWPALLADWWTAILLDGPGMETGPLVFPSVNLRGFLGSNFPLQTQSIGPGGGSPSGLLWSSAAGYYIVTPDTAGSMTVRLGGEAGGASSSQAALRMRIVRVS
jgi:hypothetical protein